MPLYEMYCVKERRKVTANGEVVTLKNGKPAARAKCPSCGTQLTKFLPQQK